MFFSAIQLSLSLSHNTHAHAHAHARTKSHPVTILRNTLYTCSKSVWCNCQTKAHNLLKIVFGVLNVGFQFKEKKKKEQTIRKWKFSGWEPLEMFKFTHNHIYTQYTHPDLLGHLILYTIVQKHIRINKKAKRRAQDTHYDTILYECAFHCQ